MKKFFIATLALFCCAAALAQDHDHHDHDHEEHDHHGKWARIHPVGCDCGEEQMHARVGDNSVTYSFTGLTPRLGLAWQKGTFAEVGVGLDLYRIGYTEASEYVTFSYRNARPYIAGEILIDPNKLLGGAKAGFEYIMSTPIFGMAAGLDASWYTDGTRHAALVTPRLMLSFVYVELYYGYNIFIHNHLRPWIGHHRVGIAMTLSPRFWKRKKLVYNDYYNTYVE